MNLPLFIARRIAQAGGKNFSRLIIRIATAAVALSVAVMIAASALIAGFKTEISRKIFEFWGHLHLATSMYTLSEPKPIPIDQPFYPSIDTVRSLSYPAEEEILGYATGRTVEKKSHGGIRHIQVYALKPGIIRTKTAMEGILLKGIGKDYDWQNMKPYLLEGRHIALNDSAPSRDILLSRQTADRLQVGVGDKFVVHFVKEGEQLRRLFEVCGIYKTGLEEYDRKFALCDIRQVQNLLGWQENEVAGFEIWLDDIRDLDVYNDYMYEEILPGDMVSATIRERFPAIFEWLQLQDYNEVVIMSLMLLVAIINMITALLVLVLERSNMIGILKALGENNSRIRWIFLYHAALITIWGLFWGNFFGLGFCWLQHTFHLIRLNEADYYLAYAPIKVELLTLLLINVGTLVITMLFLFVPSMIVTRVTPVKAIHFK